MKILSDRLAKQLPFFYGYLMLPLAVAMQIGSSPGQTFAVSAFTPSLIESLQLSQSRLGLAYMLGTVLAAIPLFLIGPAADRYGLKRVSLVVIGSLAAACLYASRVQSFLGLLSAFFLLRFLGQGSLTLLSSNTVAMWFRNRIGRVSALMSIGSALAFAWIPEWLALSVDANGWRATYQMIAVIMVVVLIPPVLLLYRNRPEDVGQFVDGREIEPELRQAADSKLSGGRDVKVHSEESLTLKQAGSTLTYYILGLSNIIWAMAGTGVLFYLFTLCEERSIPESTGTSVFKILGLTMLAAQLAGGVLADLTALHRLFGVGTASISIALVWLSVDPTASGIQVFAALFGAGQGMLISVSGVAWVRYYGREHLGKIRGTVWCGTVAGSGCGPMIMGWFKDATGNYDQAILLFASAMVPLAIAGWFIRPPQRNDGV